MIDPQLMQMLQQAGSAQAQEVPQGAPAPQRPRIDPNNPAHALIVGAVASEMLKPKRVQNLEAFIAKYPEVADMIAQALGKTMPRFGVNEVGRLSGLAELLGGMNADAENSAGPEQGPEPEYE